MTKARMPALMAVAVVAVLTGCQAWNFKKAIPWLDSEDPLQARRRLLRTMYTTIVLDYLVLAVAIWFVGGTRSPFLPFFLLHVVFTCLLLERKPALMMHWLAYALLSILVLGEWSGLLPPPHLPIGAVAGTGPLAAQPGCTICRVLADVRDEGLLSLQVGWDTEENLERHIRSDLFWKVLALMEISSRRPEIRFHTISRTEGLETIERIRGAGHARRPNKRPERGGPELRDR